MTNIECDSLCECGDVFDEHEENGLCLVVGCLCPVFDPVEDDE
jgi:hypothetical protein